LANGALHGVKVVEHTSLAAGPFCGKLLADLGAEVIKVEPPRGDEARRRGPFPGDIPHRERSGLFLFLNTNKLGVTLDATSATGARLLHNLILQSDVFIEDLTPGRAGELGFGYEELHAEHPGLVFISITPFGQTGPYREYKAYPLNSFHSGGEGYCLPVGSGTKEREPIKGGRYLGEYDAGLAAGLAGLSALFHRLATGEGQHVDVSKQEALICLQRVDLARYPNDGHIPSRSFSGWRQVGGPVECEDGWIVITAPQNHQWQGLVDYMGRPDWAMTEEAKDEVARHENVEKLQPKLEEWMRTRKRFGVYHGAQANSCPVGVIRNAQEVIESPQEQARGFFQEITHPEAGTYLYPTAPYQFSETPWALRRPAPLLGEHNEDILCGRLGLSKQDLVQLARAGII